MIVLFLVVLFVIPFCSDILDMLLVILNFLFQSDDPVIILFFELPNFILKLTDLLLFAVNDRHVLNPGCLQLLLELPTLLLLLDDDRLEVIYVI